MFPSRTFSVAPIVVTPVQYLKKLVITGLLRDCTEVIQNNESSCLHTAAPDYEAAVSFLSWRKLLFCL